jgi:3-oxoacyl-[acyl-carrier-protein] synthase-3
MIYKHSRLHTLSHVVPDEVLSSDDIENQLNPLYERLGLPKGRLQLMSGISERRLWPVGTLASDASAKAGNACLEKSGYDPRELDLLIHCSVSRDLMEPATASFVHHKMKLGHTTQVYDLSNACLGFMNACSLASGLIDAGQIKSALVVAGENGRPLIDGTLKHLLEKDHTRKSIKDQFASLTIGCGSVAGLVTHESLAPDGPRFIGGICRADTSGSELCQGGGDGSAHLQMQTDSEQLLKQGVDLAQETWRDFCDTLRWETNTPQHYITHQVGQAHRRLLYERLGLPLEKDFSSFEHFGNVGSVSLPLTLSLAQEAQHIKKGENIALLGIGSGINCMMMGMEW